MSPDDPCRVSARQVREEPVEIRVVTRTSVGDGLSGVGSIPDVSISVLPDAHQFRGLPDPFLAYHLDEPGRARGLRDPVEQRTSKIERGRSALLRQGAEISTVRAFDVYRRIARSEVIERDLARQRPQYLIDRSQASVRLERLRGDVGQPSQRFDKRGGEPPRTQLLFEQRQSDGVGEARGGVRDLFRSGQASGSEGVDHQNLISLRPWYIARIERGEALPKQRRVEHLPSPTEDHRALVTEPRARAGEPFTVLHGEDQCRRLQPQAVHCEGREHGDEYERVGGTERRPSGDVAVHDRTESHEGPVPKSVLDAENAPSNVMTPVPRIFPNPRADPRTLDKGHPVLRELAASDLLPDVERGIGKRSPLHVNHLHPVGLFERHHHHGLPMVRHQVQASPVGVHMHPPEIDPSGRPDDQDRFVRSIPFDEPFQRPNV